MANCIEKRRTARQYSKNPKKRFTAVFTAKQKIAAYSATTTIHRSEVVACLARILTMKIILGESATPSISRSEISFKLHRIALNFVVAIDN